MKFLEIYDHILDMWPEEVDISDGQPSGERGFYFKTLSRVSYLEINT
ncbi:hypothetical protein LA52FAK_06710 [Desulforhopalus sp. 52FAK]